MLPTESPNRPLWVVPESSGGIRTYAESLLPAFDASVDVTWELPRRVLFGGKPGLVHLQHEFGLFGSKLPGRYRFPAWIREMKRLNPQVKWIATAHNVVDYNYQFSTHGRGLGAIPRALANFLLLPLLRKTWTTDTWAEFDGVIVHSALQRETIVRSGCPKVAVIPHYVPPSDPGDAAAGTTSENVVLFGYFTPDKGQDVAIEAWAKLSSSSAKLILAGGPRRAEEERYYDYCVERVRALGLGERVEFTGYLPKEKISALYRDARLVLAPFRSTTGSGSLATAFSHGAAVLASDLPMNREIDSRAPGCLTFFPSESASALAESIRALLPDADRLRALRAGARAYANLNTPERVAALHWDFYRFFTSAKALR